MSSPRTTLTRAAAYALLLALLGLPTPAHATPAAPTAARGTGVRTINTAHQWLQRPAFAVNARGEGYAVWVEASGSRNRVRVAAMSPKGKWSRTTTLTKWFDARGKYAFVGTADVGVDAKGRATVAWTQRYGSQLRIVTRSSKGRGWTKPKPISPRKGMVAFPRVGVSATGHAVVTWGGDFSFKDTDGEAYAATRTPGGSWTPATRLDTGGAFKLDSLPWEPAIDNAGTATIALDEIRRDGQGDRILAVTHSPAGGWTSQVVNPPTSLGGNAPQVATTADGRTVVAWTSDQGIEAVRRDPAGTWGPVEQVVGRTSSIVYNLDGVAISDSGAVATSAQQLNIVNGRTRPSVVRQSAPGAAWQQSFASRGDTSGGWSLNLPGFAIGAKGQTALTWEERPGKSAVPRQYLRVLGADGTWGKTRRLGAFSDRQDPGFDAKGRLTVVFNDGRRIDGQMICCTTLRALRTR